MMKTITKANVVLGVGLLLTVGTILQTFRCLTSINIPVAMSITYSVHHSLPSIAQWHLFGKLDRSDLNLPKSHLPLTLEGTVVVKRNAQLTYALINDGQTTKIYHVGQTVAGATIQKIQEHGVILNNRNELEVLPLPIKFYKLS